MARAQRSPSIGQILNAPRSSPATRPLCCRMGGVPSGNHHVSSQGSVVSTRRNTLSRNPLHNLEHKIPNTMPGTAKPASVTSIATPNPKIRRVRNQAVLFTPMPAAARPNFLCSRTIWYSRRFDRLRSSPPALGRGSGRSAMPKPLAGGEHDVHRLPKQSDGSGHVR